MSREEFEGPFADEGAGDLFELLFGQHGGQRGGSRSAVVRGENLNAETTLSLEESYHGSTRLIELHGQTIRVTIKPGIADMQVLRVAARGCGRNGGPNGRSLSHHKDCTPSDISPEDERSAPQPLR